MKDSIRRLGLKAAGVFSVSVLLIAAACAQVSPEPKQAAVPLPQEQTKNEPELRTKEVFDVEKYKGMLTIRYFHLKDPKVGTGDSYLITSPDGKTMLIDGGIPDVGRQVVKYLDQLGVKTLDIVYNTHPHGDHLGGFAEILRVKDAKAYYMEHFEYTASNNYNKVIAQLDRKKIPKKMLEEGDTFELGNDVKFEVLSPKKGVLPAAIKDYDASTLNYYSLVVKMTYKDNTFLFPGDIYKDREAELIAQYGDKLDVDFVHAPHHGGASSSSPDFVNKATPKVTVLSNNKFASLDVLKRYEKTGSDVYSTGLNGNILIISDGKQLNVVTEKDRTPTK
ncbi:hypothetical protein PAESOLCIP111_04219 [Paenibacillus solanacearum]|uniref:Metallo-beta-lactamase domain-containing protein n=1 Tax=Paenibacillus solanacearum TaxID=2048548 RepID=A0A916K6Y0_9BACL|nr:MBL fold metallo-hydrolase [Paenibacillus solanacearum]CAG7641328.1 hypothetical protein PAESOLCIP111_04219 [Paenibacillus solanacearum]